MNEVLNIKRELEKLVNSEKTAFFPRFFKTGKGEYGEGDVFLGITVPNQRKVAKKYLTLSLEELSELLKSEIHEHRLTALLILVYQFEKADEKKQKKIYEFYYKNRHHVNNWDLVDASAYKIMGAYLMDRERDILFKLARSKNLWEKRMAMISTFAFIRKGDFEDALKISEILVNDPHDLIHKAVGWMLREIGKRNVEAEKAFLKKYHKTMPRTMYRYAVEHGVKID